MPGGDRSGEEAGQRLPPAPGGDQPGRVGAHAEISRMTERYDAGKAEDEIERQGEQSRDRDLAGEHQVRRRQHEGQQGGEPKGDSPQRQRICACK